MTLKVTLGRMDGGAQSPGKSVSNESSKEALSALGLVVKQEGTTLIVSDVTQGSNADEGGIRKNDVIVSAQDLSVSSLKDLVSAIQKVTPGDFIQVVVQRGGQKYFVPIER